MACVFTEVAAGFLLTAAKPTVDTARSGNHGIDGKASPEIKTWQRFGLHDLRRKKERLNREIGKDFHINFWGFLGDKEEEIERIPFPQPIRK
uniref:DUF834 domain-containing protein n=1 Tax=Oryza glaberrima TaxID=4538 RepID=I1QZL0_ORYGL